MADDDVYRFELRAKSVEELHSFLGGADWDFGCRPAVRREGSDYIVEVYAPVARLERVRSLRAAPAVNVRLIENASEVGRARQAEVGSGNRFAARQVPTGLGIKE